MTLPVYQDRAHQEPAVDRIPRLDPAGALAPVPGRSPGGLPRVVLPSGHLAVHLTRYEDVRKALSHPALSRAEANTEDGPRFLPTALPPQMLISLDAPDHGRIRRLVTPDFAATAVTALLPGLRALLEERITALRAAPRPDLFREVLDRVTPAVTGGFLGVPEEDLRQLRTASRVIQLAPEDDPEGLTAEFTRGLGYAAALVRGERPLLPGGLLSRLLERREQAEPALDDDELTVLFLTLLVTVDQNTLSVLTKAVYALLCAPPLWRAAAGDPASVPRITEELIRLLPLGGPVGFPRVARADVEFEAGTVRAGETVLPDVFRANRDPEVFPRPLAVDPDRPARRHLQFGHGLHHCLGAALARLEINEVVTALTGALPGATLDADPAALPWDEGALLRRPTALPVRF
ncbi:cytochrome P450 [Streptomyces lichenis]|uniref:Cytochrome P450 n=1 Tax=Streptomyces lichenis TaxID=2306967 RepID=A0ABT0I3V6_9ACTN|nr:cytochrome P450 [Streptomyces lichenis]MCK8676005.1 cytochrome P450 [Streptomyces lichenis]